LRAAERRARQDGADLIGVSFGVEVGLLAFWTRHHLKPVRIGFRRDASSGAHSVVLLKGLSSTGKALRVGAGRRFRRHFHRQLSESHRELEPELVMSLLNLGPAYAGRIDRHGWRAVAGFGFAARLYEACAPELRVLALRALSSTRCVNGLSHAHGQVLVIKVLQQHGWSETAAALSLPGRSQVIALLREAARVLVMHLGNAEARGFAHSLNRSSDDLH
jgi:tRNA(Met) cytidine acetyltransferase